MNNADRSRIFIIDNDLEAISAISRSLSPEHDISLYTSGEADLENLKIERPDLVLMDLELPGDDGVEIFRGLKNAGSGVNDIPVIIVSSTQYPETEATALTSGAIDYVTKPVHGSLLQLRVRNYLELKKHRDNLEKQVQQRTIELLLTKKATITGMTVMAERRDPETEGHLERTKRIVKCLSLIHI